MCASHKLLQTPVGALEQQLVQMERPLGLLVQLATERDHVPPWRLRQGLHAPVLAAGDQRSVDDEVLLATDHQQVCWRGVLLPAGEVPTVTHTTLREVLLHGRGWYGESVLHLLQMMCDEGTPSVYRSTIEWLLQPPSLEVGADMRLRGDSTVGKLSGRASLENPETGLTDGELRLLVNARYDGATFLGQTPLHVAAARGDLQMAQLLVARGAEVDAACASGKLAVSRGMGSSPISFAVSAGKTELVAFLHAQGAPLDAAVDATVVHAPSQPTGLRVSTPIREQMAAVASVHALHRAWCAWGNEGAPSVLDERESAPAPRRPAFASGSCLLHCAVQQNQLESYQLLVELGASPHTRNDVGVTPLLLAAETGSDRMLSAAIESVSSCEWSCDGMLCMRCPLNELDPLFRGTADDDDAWWLWEGLGYEDELLDNWGRASVLDLIVRRQRHEHLQLPQVAQLLQDKWSGAASLVLQWEALLAVASLTLLAVATVLSTTKDSPLAERGADQLGLPLLACNATATARANSLSEWSEWSSNLGTGAGESSFQCYVAVLVLGAVTAGEWLYTSLPLLLSSRGRSRQKAKGEPLADTTVPSHGLRASLSLAYATLLVFSVVVHPLFAPANAHAIDCWLTGVVPHGAAFSAVLGLAFLAGSFRLLLLLSLASAELGPLVLVLFSSLFGGVLRALIGCTCLLLGFSVAIFPTFRGASSERAWTSVDEVMSRLFKLLYGDFDFSDLQSASFPALSIGLFTAYTLLLLVLLANVVLGALTGAYSRLLADERRRWALLRAAFTLQAERSWLGSALKHRQLRASSRGHGARYTCTATVRPSAYCEPSPVADELRRVHTFFLTCVLRGQRAAATSAQVILEDETGFTTVDEKLAQLSDALAQSVRRRDAAERKTQQRLRELIAEQRSLVAQHPPPLSGVSGALPAPAKLPAPKASWPAGAPSEASQLRHRSVPRATAHAFPASLGPDRIAAPIVAESLLRLLTPGSPDVDLSI